jgi:hypothetical protein
VDIFVLVFTIAGFRVSIQSPEVAFLPENFYTLDLLVVPLWGLYANMIAQLLSQISSHFIIFYHRRVVAAALRRLRNDTVYDGVKSTFTLEMDCEDESSVVTDVSPTLDQNHLRIQESEALKEHPFRRPHRGEDNVLVVRRRTNIILMAVAPAIAVLVVFGCLLPTLQLETLGIIGVLVESGQKFKQAATNLSLFGIVTLLFNQAAFTGRVSDYIGLGCLACILIASVLLVPMVQSSVLLYQWSRPLTMGRRHRLEVVIEILQAWQYAEVYLVAALFTSWYVYLLFRN